jgi:hypothetical protein
MLNETVHCAALQCTAIYRPMVALQLQRQSLRHARTVRGSDAVGSAECTGLTLTLRSIRIAGLPAQQRSAAQRSHNCECVSALIIEWHCLPHSLALARARVHRVVVGVLCHSGWHKNAAKPWVGP